MEQVISIIYLKIKLQPLKGKDLTEQGAIEKSITPQEISMYFYEIDRQNTQNISKDADVSNTINNLDLIYTCRTMHPHPFKRMSYFRN